ncbi:vacuolar protein sorting-associated protein 33B-like [Ornithodoros turicata]|uniref:vacuolar protein sorting-associated protein 33B-like n=1 Tax=Ornithodoros turicata TaxID=34597 RepID=UPI00313889C4
MATLGVDSGAVIQQVLKGSNGELLINTLQTIDGCKDLVIEECLIQPLDHIASASRIKTMGGVSKIYKLLPQSPQSTSKQCAYLMRATIPNMTLVANHINRDKQQGRNCRYFIICIPRSVSVIEQILESEGVYGHVKLLDFPLGLIPLDTDVYSLELPGFFTKFFLDGDSCWTHSISQSILQLERLCGTIPHIYGQGSCAEGVLKVLKLLRGSTSSMSQPKLPRISHLFLFDRDIDYASVLLTQLTYSGLLDETFEVNCGKVSYERNVKGKNEKVRITVNSSDPVYKEIRDTHFSAVFSLLKEKAQHLQSGYDKRHGMSIEGMKNFVANELKSLQQQHSSLAQHIGSCEVIKDSRENFEEYLRTEHNLLESLEVREGTSFIEECINRQQPMLRTLRLLCLLSLTQDGVSPRDFKSLMQQFLHSHGYEHLTTFHRLKKLGLYYEQGSTASSASIGAPKLASKVAAAMASFPRSSRFSVITRRLALIPQYAGENYQLKHPDDMGYVFSGAYVPIAGRLVEQILQRDGTQGYEEALRLLPGVTLSYSSGRAGSAGSGPGRPAGDASLAQSVVLVYFLGGVTFAEISALRLLGRMKKYQIIIATTSITNGNSFLKQLVKRED